MLSEELNQLETSSFEIVDIGEPDKVIASTCSTGPSCSSRCHPDCFD